MATDDDTAKAARAEARRQTCKRYYEKKRDAAGGKPRRIFHTEEERAQAKTETKRRWAKKNAAKVKANDLTPARQKSKRATNRRYEARHAEELAAKRRTEKFRTRRRAYLAKKLSEDLNYRLASYTRNRVRECVRGRKCANTMSLVGCTVSELVKHLEIQFQPGMSWGNYGPVWHIDHRKPCASFDLTDPEQQRACFHFSNLQPLEKLENLRKGSRLEGRDATMSA